MPRWLYGTAVVVYLAGTFGFGLARQFVGPELDLAGVMAYGASWPIIMLRLLNIL